MSPTGHSLTPVLSRPVVTNAMPSRPPRVLRGSGTTLASTTHEGRLATHAVDDDLHHQIQPSAARNSAGNARHGFRADAQLFGPLDTVHGTHACHQFSSIRIQSDSDDERSEASPAESRSRFLSVASAFRIQAKLTFSSINDPCEREADAMADRIVRHDPTPGTIGGEPTAVPVNFASTSQIHAKFSPASATRSGSQGMTTADMIPSGGTCLAPDVRTFFECRFGHDFSRVRVHTDGDAALAAHAIGARAYTHGSSVVFGQGEYAPSTRAGQRLLAHELTHVVQQSTGGLSSEVIARAPKPHMSGASPTDTLYSYAVGSRNTLIEEILEAMDVPKVTIDDILANESEKMALWDEMVKAGIAKDIPDPVSVPVSEQARLSPAEQEELYDWFVKRYSVTVPQPSAPPSGASISIGTSPTPDDMVTMVVNQRGFSAGPIEPGKSLGPGWETNAAIKVVDGNGNQVAFESGLFAKQGSPHAEAGAIARLRARLGGARFPGGSLVVAVDQFACPSCMAKLREFAKELELQRFEVWGPVRPKMVGHGDASPKTTAKTATHLPGGTRTSPSVKDTMASIDVDATHGGITESPKPQAGEPTGGAKLRVNAQLLQGESLTPTVGKMLPGDSASSGKPLAQRVNAPPETPLRSSAPPQVGGEGSVKPKAPAMPRVNAAAPDVVPRKLSPVPIKSPSTVVPRPEAVKLPTAAPTTPKVPQKVALKLPSTAPSVKLPSGGSGVRVSGRGVRFAGNLALQVAGAVAMSLLEDWVVDEFMKSDVKALQGAIVERLEALEPEITKLQSQGKVYCRVTYNFRRRSGVTRARTGVPYSMYEGTTLAGVEVVGNDTGSSSVILKTENESGETIENYLQTVTTLIDDPEKRAREQKNSELSDKLVAIGKKSPPPKQPSSPVTPPQQTADFLSPPKDASLPTTAPSKESPGTSSDSLNPAAFLGPESTMAAPQRWITNAENYGNQLIRRGTHLEDLVRQNNRPGQKKIDTFLFDEGGWRTSVEYQLNWAMDNWPGEAREGLRALLEDPSKPGPRLSELHEHLKD